MTDQYVMWKDLAKYIRTCQACGHEDEYKAVETYNTNVWQDVKCKKCRSEALDYGSYRHANDCECHYCKSDE